MKSLLESGMTDYRKILFLTFSILLFTSSVSVAYAQDEPKTYPNYRAYDYDGNTVRLVDLEGQVVLLNVWATWCISCRAEHPYLTELAKRGVAIYGINYKDEDAAALAWLDELGDPSLASIADHDGTLGLDLGVYGAPETYLVDANGLVRYRHVGVVNERVWSNVLQPIYEQLKNGKVN